MADNKKDPVREFLESYWELRRETDRLDRRVYELTVQCENVTAKYTGMPRGGGGSSTTAWDALIEAKALAEARLVESLRREVEIEDFVDTIPNKVYRQLLRYRYLEDLTWETIGNLMHYHPVHVRLRLHGAALNAAREKWEEREEQNS